MSKAKNEDLETGGDLPPENQPVKQARIKLLEGQQYDVKYNPGKPRKKFVKGKAELINDPEIIEACQKNSRFDVRFV